MADKRISQLIERVDIANNDVLPIVASGATTTNKVTISTIQDWMQENLDVGVTSVGITIGTSGTDVTVSGSPITTSGNITINIPDASASARGVVTTGTQTFAGYKIFNGTIGVNQDIQLATQGTALNTFIKNINATGLTSIGSNGFGFNNANNIYFSGSSKGGGIFAFNNTGNQTYTLQDASGTLAFTSDLGGYVTLGTSQTITAQKTFTTSGSSDTLIVDHTSGSGIAVDISKGGNGEGLRVAKTSGSGNAVTITGGILSAEEGLFSGDLQSNSRLIASTGGQSIILTANSGGTTNRIEGSAGLPMHIVTSGSALALAAGGTTPQITLASSGAVTLTGALSGTSAVFTQSDAVPLTVVRNTANSNVGIRYQNNTTSWYAGQASDGAFGISFNAADLSSGQFKLSSTGAATFSSSVTTNTSNNFNISSGPYNAIFHNNSTSTSDYNSIRITQGASGSATGYFGTGGSAVGNTSFANTFAIGTQSNHAFVLNTNDTERMRITSDAYLRMASGSGGIQFNGDTAAANALDDYEEGTWTPAFIGGGGTATYNNRRGWYTKIGRQVTIVWQVEFQKNTISSSLGMSGLPFTVLADGSVFYPQGTVLLDNLSTTTNNITFQVANGSTQGDFIGGNGGTSSHTGLPASALGSGTMMCRGTATYFV